MTFLARCLCCPWKGDRPSNSLILTLHYALKHVKEANTNSEGFVATAEIIGEA